MSASRPDEGSVEERGALAPPGNRPGPSCALSQWALRVLAGVLYVFGLFYALDPSLSISSINTIALGLGLHLPVPPAEPTGFFYGWIGFTFAYMMAAATCAVLASGSGAERFAYLNVLLVLKGTSSLTGLLLFLGQDRYAFYLATFLTDGLLFGLVLVIRTHLRRVHAPTGAATAA